MRTNTVIQRSSLAVALTLAAAIASIPSAKTAQTPAPGAACQLHQVASLDLKLTRGGGVLVPVTMRKTAVYMYLEIGSAFSGMSQHAVDRFALPKTEIAKGLDISTDTKRVEHYATTTDFALGGISYPSENFLIMPEFPTSATFDSEEIIGMLGIDLLWKMDLELDLAPEQTAGGVLVGRPQLVAARERLAVGREVAG